MKPVNQTLFGDGSEGTDYGNCFIACLATILEYPLRKIPHFCEDKKHWFQHCNIWLSEFGLSFFECRFTAPAEVEISYFSNHWGYHLIGGESPRGIQHWVVGKEGKIVHDPHPSKTGLIGEPTDWSYGLILVRDPAGFFVPTQFLEDLP